MLVWFGEKTRDRWNALCARDTHTHSGKAHEKHDSANARVINRIRIAGEQGIHKQRRAHQQDIKRQKNADEDGADHEVRETVSNPSPQVKRLVRFERLARRMRGGGVGYAAQQSIADAPGFFSGVGILREVIKGFSYFAKMNVDVGFGSLTSNMQMQQVARFLLAHPFIKAPWRVAAIPSQDYIANLQAGL